MKHNTQFKHDEDAVSPVIGVILMVAITVILAAVIGTFVLDLGGQVETNVQAGATVKTDTNADTISVTWTSNQNAESLDISIDGTLQSTLNDVGESMSFTGTDGATHQVVVTANKGSQSTVIIDAKKSL